MQPPFRWQMTTSIYAIIFHCAKPFFDWSFGGVMVILQLLDK